MPFQRPTLPEIKTRIVSDIETGLGIAKLLYRSVLRITAIAFGGAVHSLHGHLDWVSKQLMPDTADADYLARWASIWGVPRRSASFAEGLVTFSGTSGVTIPSGVEVQRGDGERYATLADGTVSGGVVSIEVEAVNAGALPNTEAGSTVTLISPIAGINSNAVVAAGGIAGGADRELDDPLRVRLIERIQSPPNGGSQADYKKWALEVSGVTRAFVYGGLYGLGTVGVAILADNDPGGPVAPDQLVDDVQDYIDTARPVTADVTVWTPVAEAMNVTIDINPDSAAIRSAVQASLRDLLRREAEPGKTILISKIREAVSTAAGENDNAVSVPSGNFTVAANKIAILGTITWV